MGLEYLVRITCDNPNCVYQGDDVENAFTDYHRCYRDFKDESEAKKAGWACVSNKWYCAGHASSAKKAVPKKKVYLEDEYESIFEMKSRRINNGDW